MKKLILSKFLTGKQVIVAMLFIHDNIKFLIDDNNVVYHYTDRVAIGKYNPSTKEVYFYFETQQQYDDAVKNNNVIVKRTLEK